MKKLLLIISFFSTLSLYAKSNSDLKFNNGKFKIVQFTDTHYAPNNDDAKKSLKIIEDALRLEKPDLIILSGDIVVTDKNLEGWNELLKPIIDSKIPYVFTFGNHDNEGTMTKEEIYKLITSKPYNINGPVLKGVYGVTNQAIEIKGDDGKTKSVCWIFDSNSYSTLKGVEGYGWIERSQIDWYSNKSKEFTAKNGGTPLPSLSFFHIALPEHRKAYDKSEGTNVGLRGENECPPEENSGLFLEMLKRGDVMSVFVGHDHDNDYVAKYRNILLGFGRFTGSKTTYTSKGSGARLFELTEGERVLKTWIMDSDLTFRDTINYPFDYEKDNKLYRNKTLDSVSYAFGNVLARHLISSNLNIKDINLSTLQQAMNDFFMNKERYSAKIVNQLLSTYLTEINSQQYSDDDDDNEKALSQYISDKKILDSLLKENKNIKKTDIGLYYEIISAGDATQKPTSQSNITINYTGKLMTGEEFDSSYKNGEPSTFNINGVIEGLKEGVQLIGVGGKINLWIPSVLAYGESGVGDGLIPRRAMIHFEVELLDI